MGTTMVTSSSSCSAETVEGNEYLLTEILVHLPAKSLLGLKRVSKRWDSLISSPYFRGRQTLLHGAAAATKVSGMILHLDLCSRPEQFKLFSFKNGRSHRSPSPFNWVAKNHNPSSIYIWQSCNGLILGSVMFPTYKSSPESYFIANPTTKDFALIPHPGPATYQAARLGLAFDPLLSPSYTVIFVWRPSGSCRYRFMVYSSETRAWKACESSSVAPTDARIGRGVYSNGAVHWFCWRQSVSLCFDVREECIKDKMPPLPKRGRRYYHAAPSRGHLNLVGIGGSDINVFRLERDYSRRVPMHTVCVQHTQLPTAFPDMFCPCSSTGQTEMFPQYSVLCLMQDDREEDGEDGDHASLLLETPSKVIALRLKDNTFYEVFDLGRVWRRGIVPGLGRYTASAFVESLACV